MWIKIQCSNQQKMQHTTNGKKNEQVIALFPTKKEALECVRIKLSFRSHASERFDNGEEDGGERFLVRRRWNDWKVREHNTMYRLNSRGKLFSNKHTHIHTTTTTLNNIWIWHQSIRYLSMTHHDSTPTAPKLEVAHNFFAIWRTQR